MERRLDDARGDRIKANMIFRVFARKAKDNCIQSALGHHRDRRRNACDRVIDQSRCDACHAAAVALRQHLPDCKLRDEDEPFQVDRHEAAKLFRSVLRKRFHREDACIIDNVIDRAELLYRGLCDLRGRRCLTDVTVEQHETR